MLLGGRMDIFEFIILSSHILILCMMQKERDRGDGHNCNFLDVGGGDGC